MSYTDYFKEGDYIFGTLNYLAEESLISKTSDKKQRMSLIILLRHIFKHL